MNQDALPQYSANTWQLLPAISVALTLKVSIGRPLLNLQ